MCWFDGVTKLKEGANYRGSQRLQLNLEETTPIRSRDEPKMNRKKLININFHGNFNLRQLLIRGGRRPWPILASDHTQIDAL